MDPILVLTTVAAGASLIGAIFAMWRWDYARRAFKLQKIQLKLQVMMLMESREYWETPKMQYVAKRRRRPESDKELIELLKELVA